MHPFPISGPARCRAVALLVIAALLATACARDGSTAGRAGAGAGARGLSEAELQYGQAPEPHPDVTYAPDVVLVGGGAEAVRSVTGDGLTWTIDRQAPRADELEVGKVMFLTGRGVGRIHAVETQGDELVVTIGPVDITEVIWDGEFAVEDLELDLDRMVVYDTGEQAWSVSELPPTEDPELDGEVGADGDAGDPGPPGIRRPSAPVQQGDVGDPGPPGIRRSSAPVQQGDDPAPPETVRRIPSPPARTEPQESTVGAFKLTTICCEGGTGVHLSHESGGTKLSATMTMLVERPRATWHLEIGAGTVKRAELQVHGGAGFSYRFDARTTSGIPGNINQRVAVPASLSIPFMVAGVPFSLTVTQSLLVRTAFSARDSWIKGAGRWGLSGSLGFGYRAGSFDPRKPGGFTTSDSVLDSIEGVSVGVTGLVLGHALRVTVGIGWEVFNVGPYAELVTSLGIHRGSDLAAPLVVCRGATVTATLGYGIGYSLPKVVVEVVNFILRLVGATTITQQGSLVGTRVQFVNESARAPSAAACQS